MIDPTGKILHTLDSELEDDYEIKPGYQSRYTFLLTVLKPPIAAKWESMSFVSTILIM